MRFLTRLVLILLFSMACNPNNLHENDSNPAANGESENLILPDIPQGVSVSAADGKVTISWNKANNADKYNIYWGTTSGISTSNTKIEGAFSPFTLNYLSNGTTYFFRVSAQNEDNESGLSIEVSATPLPLENVLINEASISFGAGDNVSNVTQNFTLPSSTSVETNIAWSSDNDAVIISGSFANVTRPAFGSGNVAVTLTATITSGSTSETKTFHIIVKELPQTDADKVAEDKAALSIIFSGSDSEGSVTQNMTLRTNGLNGTSISWDSNRTDVISSNGTITRPLFGEGDVIVTLTATISKNATYDTRIFILTVKQETEPRVPVLDTGQTSCYDNLGLQSCGNTENFPNQDADFADIPHSRSFTGPTAIAPYINDFITTDNVTGLVWKTCTEGLSGANCAGGTASTYTWANAGTQCQSLNSLNSGAGYAGRTTWRLPSKKELASLRNYGISGSIIDNAKFPGTIENAYWSSTTYANNSLGAWVSEIWFEGWMCDYSKTTKYYVLCVSPGNFNFPDANSYKDNGDSTVTDLSTGLRWQKCSRGQNNDAACGGTPDIASWQENLKYCANLALADKSWRLPNINELLSLVDDNRAYPAIDVNMFPGLNLADYSSSTSSATNPANAWNLTFSTGAITSNSKNLGGRVRCVHSNP